MNTIRSVATRSFEAITSCDGRKCEDIGMAMLTGLAIFIMFLAFSQMA